MVYIHRLGLPTREADLQFIFDDAPCGEVGSVLEQNAFREQWVEALKNAR